MKRFFCILLSAMLVVCFATTSFAEEKPKTVTFGTFEQSYPGEDISWIVLSSSSSTTVLLSEYCLECRRYDTKTNKWSKSSLRKWLNDKFLYEAFTEDERDALIMNSDDDYVTIPTLGDVLNEQFGFINNAKAADESRAAVGTAYAINRGLWRNRLGQCSYFTRTPTYDGIINQVRTDGTIGEAAIDRENVGVRVLIYVKTDALP